jgi:hypothetical protein
MKDLLTLHLNMADNPDQITFTGSEVQMIIEYIENLEHKVKMLSL